MRLYAGFMKAERERECVTIPAFCVADDEQHARATLTTWAKDKWPTQKGWRLQQGYCREIIDEALFMDDRVAKLKKIEILWSTFES